MFHIIVNPMAGKGYSNALVPPIENAMRERGMAFTVLYTRAPNEAKILAESACRENSEGIIAVGGDGTVQEAVCGMHSFFGGNIAVPFGIVPCGSGNDFWLAFAKNKKRGDGIDRIDGYINNVFEKKTRAVDLISANGEAFINIANIGLDAHIVKNAAALKKPFKGKAYTVSALLTILRFKTYAAKINIDGRLRGGRYTLIAVCNGQYYGGGMRISPGADIHDGQLTVCLIRGMSKLRTFMLFPTLLAEKHTKLNVIEYINCKNFSVDLSNPDLLCMDGNLFEGCSKVDFSVLPEAINIFID